MPTQTEEFHVKFSADNTQYLNAMGKGREASEAFEVSQGRMRKVLAQAATGIAGITSASDAATVALGAMGSAFRGSMGIGIGAAIGVSLQQTLKGTAAEMERLSDIAGGVFAQRVAVAGKSTGDLEAEMKAAQAASQEFAKALTDKSFSKFLGDTAGALFGGANWHQSDKDNQANMEAMNKVVIQRQKDMVTLEKQRVQVALMLSEGYDEQATALARQQKNEAELVNAERIGGKEYAAQVRSRQELEQKADDRKKANLVEQAVWQGAILKVQEEGSNVAVKVAQLRLAEASDNLSKNNDSENSPVRAGLVIAKEKAALDLKTAEKATALMKDEQQIKGQLIADERTGDKQHRETLRIEADLLAKRREAATADEIPGIDLQLGQNALNQINAAKAEKDSSLNRISGRIEANKGFGPSAELEAMKGQAEVLKGRLKIEEQSEIVDNDRTYELNTQIKLQERSIRQAEAEKTIHDSALDAGFEQVKIQGDSTSEATKRYKITLSQIAAVDAEIAAMRSLNPELARAAELRKQGLQNDLQSQDEGLNLGKSSKQIHDRFTQERQQQRQVDNFRQKRENDSGLIDVHRDMSGAVISGKNPITGEQETRQPGSNLDDIGKHMADPNSGPSLRDRMKDDGKNFADRFKPKPKDDAFRPVDQAPGAGAVKDNAADIGSKLDDIKTAILKAIAQ